MGASSESRAPRAAKVIHVDTNFLIRAQIVGTWEGSALSGWIRAAEPLGISSPAWTEFLCGPVTAEGIDAAATMLHTPVPFGATEATGAARLFNESGRRRGSLVDCMIAATAIEAGARLATANPQHFRRFEPLGLQLAGPR